MRAQAINVGLFTFFTGTIMHLVYPPKFCITIVSNFSWVITVVPKTMLMQFFFFFWGGGGVNKAHYDDYVNVTKKHPAYFSEWNANG